MEPKPRSARRGFGWFGRGSDLRKQLEEARRAYEPDRVLELLAEAPSNASNLEEYRLWAHREKQREAQLRYARQHGRWDRVLAILDGAPPNFPNLANLRAEAEAALRPRASPSGAPAAAPPAEPGPGTAPGAAELSPAQRPDSEPSGSTAPAEAALGLGEPAAAPTPREAMPVEEQGRPAPVHGSLGESEAEFADLPSALATDQQTQLPAAAFGERQESAPTDSSLEPAAPAVDEAVAEAWRRLPAVLRRFDREEIDRVVETCRQRGALADLQLQAEQALANDSGNLAALALAGDASAALGHLATAVGYYAQAVETAERGARRQDWIEHFYVKARALDPRRAFALIDRSGGVYDTEEGRRYLLEQALALGPEEEYRQTALSGLLAVDECRKALAPLLAARAYIKYTATSSRNVDWREAHVGYSKL